VNIGGVRTNFRMPDILAIGLGGGSRVRSFDREGHRRSHAGAVTIGPDSVGYELTKRARVFGGEDLTLTDIAVAAGILELGDRSRVADLDPGFTDACLHEMHVMLGDAVDRMKTSSHDVPVILVGGGAPFVTRPLEGTSRVFIPAEAGVANAIGAAIAQVSGEVDRVYSYDAMGREAALEDARRLACARAREAGATANVRVLDVEEIPLAYVPGGAVRLRVKALGELPLTDAREMQP
jgi:N-methylhydantoinase A/oxoprolinase/acetone carboxylase beta subunit